MPETWSFTWATSFKLTPNQIEAFKEWETFLPKENK